MKRPKAEQVIAELCRKAGCNEKQRLLHNEQFLRHHWHPHPPAEFELWWETTGKDSVSGASIGGHPDAVRVWARPEENGGWKRAVYGISALVAWNVQRYRNQFRDWEAAGYPERAEEFISIAATLARQAEYWKRLTPVIEMIGRKPAEKAQIKAAFDTDKIIEELNRDFPG